MQWKEVVIPAPLDQRFCGERWPERCEIKTLSSSIFGTCYAEAFSHRASRSLRSSVVQHCTERERERERGAGPGGEGVARRAKA